MEVAATGLEHPSQTPEEDAVSHQGGAQSGALGADKLVEALALISKLPLSNAEKAEVVRRLIAGTADSNSRTIGGSSAAATGKSVASREGKRARARKPPGYH